MSQLFNRYVGVTVGKAGEEGIIFEGVRIKFTVKKTSEKNPNTGQIQIFNLSDRSIGLIEQKKQRVILEAGYLGLGRAVADGALTEKPFKQVIGVGDVRNVNTVMTGVDRITTFEIGDGEDAIQNATLEKSFPPGISTADIMGELQNSIGAVKGVISGIKDQIFNNGVSVSGKVSDQLDKITAKMGAQWSIQDGELQVLPLGESVNLSAVELSPSTGLIGSPSRKLAKKKTGESESSAVEFTCLLNPFLKPGRKVKITSRNLQGTFVIRTVTFSGDNKQGDFICKGEAV